MWLAYLKTSLFVGSLFLICIASKKIIDALRFNSIDYVNNKIMCFFIALVTVVSVLSGFYSLQLLPQEGALGLYVTLFLVSLLLVCCLLLMNEIIVQLKTKAQQVESSSKPNLVKDPVTGIYNRLYIEDRLDEEVARYKRYSTPLSVLTINVSNFHRYNTIYGFQAGDKVLKGIASGITASIRETDVAARYEADQFVILLTNTPESSITPVLNRLKRNFGNLKAQNVDSTEAHGMLNVNFGNVCCGLSTPSGRALITAALDSIQAGKLLLNEQDTLNSAYVDLSKKRRYYVT